MDGNCQFHAVAHQLRLWNVDSNVTHTELRSNVVTHLRNNFNNADSSTSLQNFVTCDFKTYLHAMSKNGEFGDNITLQAVCELYNCQIVIVSSNPNFKPQLLSSTISYDPDKHCIILGHFEETKGEHYVSLELSSLSGSKHTLNEYMIKTFDVTDKTIAETETFVCQEQQLPTEASTSTPTPVTDLGTMCSGPVQPRLNKYPLSKFGKQNRGFSTQFYASFPFIEYSCAKNSVFCFPCRMFSCDSGYTEPAFTKVGVQDWKNLSKKLLVHMSAQSHKDSCCKYDSFQQCRTSSVMSKLSQQHEVMVSENRQYTRKIIDILLYLSRQGLAFRGHDESSDSHNRGNFLELCDLFAVNDDLFASKLQKYCNLTSHDIQNRLINIAAKKVTDKIAQEVMATGFYCILADEARSFKREQLSVCVRYTNENLQLKERFIGFADCSSSSTADGIANCISEVIEKAGLGSIPIIAQSYDGASVMSGRENGVQQKIRQLHPSAVYVHCMAHRMNLVLVESCKVTRHAQAFFGILESLYCFFARPNNHEKFKIAQTAMGIQPLELTQLSDTRWACRWRNVNSTKRLLHSIKACLTELSEPHNRCFVEAEGLLMQLQKYEFVVCLAVFDKLLSLVQVPHKFLQSKGATLAAASSLVNNTLQTFQEMRDSDKAWKEIWQSVDEMLPPSKDSNNPPSSTISITDNPKQRQPRKLTRMEDFVIMSTCGQRSEIIPNTDQQSSTAVADSKSETWRKQLFLPVIDTLVGELKRRFASPQSMSLSKSVCAALLLEGGGVDYLLNSYADTVKISPELAKTEMQIAKQSILHSTGNTTSTTPSSQYIVNTESLQRLSAASSELRSYPNLFKLLQLAVTLPVSSATCERSFSAIRRVNNYLRSTMGQERLSSLGILNIESELAADLDTNDIINEFAQSCKKIQL